MKNIKPTKNVKMNLTLTKEFFDLLQTKAEGDYIKVSTWVKRFLMQKLLEKNNSQDSKSLTKNGTTMEL